MVPRQPHFTSHLTPHLTSKHLRTSSPFSTQSQLADDERSSASTGSSMGPSNLEQPSEMPPPKYPGEDTRPTSRKELLGFYAYSFAAEVFVVCGLGAFIPMTLEDLARDSATAVLAKDPTKSCRAHKIERVSQDSAHPASGGQCVFQFFGHEINTASFAMYTFSVSVLLQSLIVVTMSGAADHGQYRKKLLLIFAFVGSIATMLFLPVTPAVYLLGSLWAIVGNVCFGASFVLLNSFLPLLVRHHPNTGISAGEHEPIQSDEVSQRIFRMMEVGICACSRRHWLFRSTIERSNSTYINVVSSDANQYFLIDTRRHGFGFCYHDNR